MSEYEGTICAIVVLPGDEGNTAKLEVNHKDDVLTFSLDGEELFRMDWTMNAIPMFERMRIMWKEEN